MTFLILYDRARGAIVRFEAFAEKDHDLAQRKRLEIELELNRSKSNVDHEVVLLEAPTEEALLQTHRRYFKSIEEIVNSSSNSP